jgi:hypothetical protein
MHFFLGNAGGKRASPLIPVDMEELSFAELLQKHSARRNQRTLPKMQMVHALSRGLQSRVLFEWRPIWVEFELLDGARNLGF